MAKTKAKEGKTVGVPLRAEDIDALEAYRDAREEKDMVRPGEGPAALELLRRGMRAWEQEARS